MRGRRPFPFGLFLGFLKTVGTRRRSCTSRWLCFGLFRPLRSLLRTSTHCILRLQKTSQQKPDIVLLFRPEFPQEALCPRVATSPVPNCRETRAYGRNEQD